MTLLSMSSLDLTNKRVLIREDLNVPINKGTITNDARIRAALPTLQHAINANARVMVMSHLGRPTEGAQNPDYSLKPIAKRLSKLLNKEVKLVRNWDELTAPEPGEIVLCENVRFLKGEESNDPILAKRMAKHCDVFVMDAFGSAHRAHASTYGVAQFAKIACAGPLLLGELQAIDTILRSKEHPTIAIVGGSKVSTKVEVLKHLCQNVDTFIFGGGIANTFLAASGHPIGLSLSEPDLIPIAKTMLEQAARHGCTIVLPIDVVVAKSCTADAIPTTKSLNEVETDDRILDIGPKTITLYDDIIKTAKTILWNGPLGVFEIPAFSHGTQALARSISQTKAYSVAGGGDTLAAIETFGVAANISYISTGGGAFLEMLEGKTLPAVAILEKRGLDSRSPLPLRGLG